MAMLEKGKSPMRRIDYIRQALSEPAKVPTPTDESQDRYFEAELDEQAIDELLAATASSPIRGESRKRTLSCVTSDSTVSSSSSTSTKRARHGYFSTPSTSSSAATQGDSTLQGYHIIAHSKMHIPAIERRSLCWGVQWEIARLISTQKLSWDDLEVFRLDELRGKNAEVPCNKVSEVLLSVNPNSARESTRLDALTKVAYAHERALNDPHRFELDAEEEALRTSNSARLGSNSPHDTWYGGKVQHTGQLCNLSSNNALPRYGIRLEKLRLGRSNRFTRFYGSRRILVIKIPTQLFRSEGNGLVNFFLQGFVILGRVYRAFFAKEQNVYLMETNEPYDLERRIEGNALEDGRLSFEEFISWHNSIARNNNQTMSKWASRFALGLSTSVPMFSLSPQNIIRIPDEVAPYEGPGKPPSKNIMTDGCGLMNLAAAKFIAERLKLQSAPTAIQCRVAGSKGLLLLDLEETERKPTPIISVRDSQVKIELDMPDHAQLTLDLLRSGHFKYPANLSAETIVNLSHNGVPISLFVEMICAVLSHEVEVLTTWDGPDAMLQLWDALCRKNGVIASRMRREQVSSARALGFGEDPTKPIAVDEDDPDDITEQSAAWFPDEISGLPSTLEESVLVLLTAGFNPGSCPMLLEKLKQVIITHLNTIVKRCHFALENSLDAFVVPDPFGVLEEGEISVRLSKPVIDLVTGLEVSAIEGDVLVTRHPCKVPSDIQKVKAVDHPKLRPYGNVIVFSIKGERSLASLLGGGDYDGDTVTVIWDKKIVDSFVNANVDFAEPPENLMDSFERKNETIADFEFRTASLQPRERTVEVQRYLLSSLQDTTIVGAYSNWHDVAVYTFGYSSPIAIELAYKFCTCLDGAKTGFKIKEEVRAKDALFLRKYGSLGWKESDEDAQSKAIGGEVKYCRRPPELGTFVMDAIKGAARALKGEKLRALERTCQDVHKKSLDVDLLAPFKDAQKRTELSGIPAMVEELGWIKDQVVKSRDDHRNSIKGSASSRSSSWGEASRVSFTDMRIEGRQDLLRRLSTSYHASLAERELVFFSMPEVKRIAASYAYELCGKAREYYRFPWDVACRDLCAIKASANGQPYSTFTSRFADKMVVHRRSIRTTEPRAET
ncbi:hypothetical protein BOTBODRAFT_156039 [Botryobasidium botryosum FD-172 SS1]|uniref:RNA-dependent RNA polymerase n=1 Tax=Botryobasidium botryosum (strain FD-172 SS1) TaxID=930990 RepID=A0A067MRE2_BOTB1|nr:hypothetical protein BOTBODRAFT_156039 [Botryobasidium botryosum FD-172 SS1]